MTQALTTGVNQLTQGEVYALPGFPCQFLSDVIVQSSLSSAGPFSDLIGSNVEPGKQIDGGFAKSVSVANVVIKKHLIYSPGQAPYYAKIIASGPSNYWRLGETYGTVAKDVIGGALTTINGNPVLGGENGITFDQNDDNVSITPTIPLPLICTIEGWLKTPSASGLRPLFSTHHSSGTVPLMPSVGEANGYPQAFLEYNGTTAGTIPVPVGQWTHLTYVLNGTIVSYYVNGVAAGTAPLVRTQINTGTYSYIGWFSGFMAGSGSIKDVAIYPRALSAAEILDHYKAR